MPCWPRRFRMPEWYLEAAKVLEQVARANRPLLREILLALQRLQRNPLLGDHVMKTYRVYVDPERRFRIGYNCHPKKSEIEIVVLHLLDHPTRTG